MGVGYQSILRLYFRAYCKGSGCDVCVSNKLIERYTLNIAYSWFKFGHELFVAISFAIIVLDVKDLVHYKSDVIDLQESGKDELTVVGEGHFEWQHEIEKHEMQFLI